MRTGSKARRRAAMAALALLTACESPRSPSVEAEELGGADRGASSAFLRPVVEATTAGDGAGLRAFLADPDPRVRARAAYGAATLADPSLLTALRARLDDPGPAVRAAAAFALERTPWPEDEAEAVTRDLRERLERERQPPVRAAVVRALGRRGTPEVSLLLAARVGEDLGPATDALAVMAARGALAPPARDTLLARLAMPDPGVREAAARGVAMSDAPDLWIRHREALRAALANWGPQEPAARHLLASVGRLLPRQDLVPWTRTPADPRVRLVAIRALTTHPDGVAVVPDLAAALSDPHPWVRQAAAAGLVQYASSPAAVAALAGVVGEAADPATEEAWLRVLAATGRWEELEGRVAGRSLDDGVAWRAALAVLPGVGDSALVALLEPAADGPLPAVRRSVRHVLGLAPDSADAASDAPPGHAPPGPESPGPGRPWTGRDWDELAALGESPALVLETDAGSVEVRLDPAGAPATVLHLARRVAAGDYDGAILHRILPGALVQFGRPGPAGPGPVAEAAPTSFRRGVVGWAASGPAGDDDLFVALDALPELDGLHTPVGVVVDGLEVLEVAAPGTVIRRARIDAGAEGVGGV